MRKLAPFALGLMLAGPAFAQEDPDAEEEPAPVEVQADHAPAPHRETVVIEQQQAGGGAARRAASAPGAAPPGPAQSAAAITGASASPTAAAGPPAPGSDKSWWDSLPAILAAVAALVTAFAAFIGAMRKQGKNE